MSSNIINSGAFLRTAREFPHDPDKLTLQINKSWVDIANAVNSRINGLYPVNGSAITGEQWFITANQRQQSLRRVYTFKATGNIPHEIFTNISSISPRSYGVFTDGTNFYGAIFASSVAIAGQVSFYVTPTVGMTSGNIVVLSGAGAPAITSGIILLEWLSAV